MPLSRDLCKKQMIGTDPMKREDYNQITSPLWRQRRGWSPRIHLIVTICRLIFCGVLWVSNYSMRTEAQVGVILRWNQRRKSSKIKIKECEVLRKEKDEERRQNTVTPGEESQLGNLLYWVEILPTWNLWMWPYLELGSLQMLSS